MGIAKDIFIGLSGFGVGVFSGAMLCAVLNWEPGESTNSVCLFFGFLGVTGFLWQFA